MSFRLPGASNSPSTPSGKSRSLFSQPSTTPAGPPPSYLTNPSTTPAGPPPRSVFGSSYNAANNTFGRRGNTSGRKGFAVPESSPPLAEDDDADADGEVDEELDGVQQSLGNLIAPMEKSMFMSSVLSSPRGLKRTRNGQVREQQQDGEYGAIARGMAKQSHPVQQLAEPDDVVLQQEQIVSSLDAKLQAAADDPEVICGDGSAQLTKLWAQYSDATTKEGRLGPASSIGLTRANYVASLLLRLRHPQTSKPTQFSRQQRSTALTNPASRSSSSIPRALLDWLDIYHNPFPDDFDPIHLNQPSPSAHERFWDVIYSSLSRGRFERVIRLLKDAGWENAITAQDDYPNHDVDGYSDHQVANIELAIGHCIQLLRSSPAVRYDDWDVKGSDWAVFRQRVRQAIKDLESFAGEDSDIQHESRNVFAESADLGQSMTMSTVSRKAESKVPWSIYENLKLVYGQLLGNIDELIDTSQDWLEASLYLTIWWDGNDEGSTGLTKSSMRKSMTANQKTREVDVATATAYQRRLADALTIVTESDEAVFQPQTLDPVEVTIGSVMEDDAESVIAMLRTWSAPVASAVVELATIGGWLPQGRPRSRGLLEQGFSSEDLMVLSHGPGSQQRPQPGGNDRDDVLAEYAELLAQKDVFRSSDGKNEREGWELAVQVLGRLEDLARGQRSIGEMLDRIEFTDGMRVDKVLAACAGLGLDEQARSIAERYADAASADRSYGSALVYYARGHASAKLKDALSQLISASLLQSAAWPAQQELDAQLAALLSQDRAPLVQLAHMDTEAAALLSSCLSGYATLRRFYEVRDQPVIGVAGGSAVLRPLERKREVAKALMAVLESAADCIRGGLFDKDVESVVPVDGVLVLLGETLPLLGHDKRIFTKDQVFTLLRILEDFATAPSRVRAKADELLQASINRFHDGDGSGSALMNRSKQGSGLSKSVGGLGGSSYDMLASSIEATAQERGEVVERAWDWRRGLQGVKGLDMGGDQVVALLRLALAREVARGWGGLINWGTL